MSALRSGQSFLRHPLTAPLTLVAVVSSLALNRATAARIEREDQKRHSTQVSFLREQLRELSRRTSRTSEEEWALLARRCITLGLDPAAVGVPDELVPVGLKGPYGSLTWTQVFFGGDSDGDGLLDKLKASITKAASGLGAQFASADNTDVKGTSSSSAGTQEEQDEWEKALIASISTAEAREKEQEEARLRAEAQRRDAYAREAREAYMARVAQELAERREETQVQAQSHSQSQSEASQTSPTRRRMMI